MVGWVVIVLAVVLVLLVASLTLASWRGRDGAERRAADEEARQRAQARREDADRS
jgi:Tfp pilus assembly protein PilX